MAYGDYIHCCKCDVKLIYDGDRSQRNWWVERFGKEPEIECPNCKSKWVGLTAEDLSVWPPPKREWVRLTDEEIFELGDEHGWYDDFGRWTFNGAGLIKFVLAIKTAEWIGLTDEEIKALPSWWPSYNQMPALMILARDIENSLKEKNGG